jgi:hypothetical protein
MKCTIVYARNYLHFMEKGKLITVFTGVHHLFLSKAILHQAISYALRPRVILFIYENCALLGCYTERSGYFLFTFRCNLSVPSPGVKKMGPIGSTETSLRNYHYSLRNNPVERFSYLLLGTSLKSRLFIHLRTCLPNLLFF